jgi:NAD(P)H-dependent FMN reductase
MNKPRILVFGGSLRLESYNQKLATIAAEGAREAGAEVTLIALRDFRMPIFDEDLEAAEGMPETARKLKALFAANDWVSRTTSEDEKPLSVLSGKSAAILSASPGGYGGSRSLAQLRPFLENIHITVLPGQVSVPKAYEAFDAAGNLIDPELQATVKALAASLVEKLA